MNLRQCMEYNAGAYSIKLLGCVMRYVLEVPLGRPLRIRHVSMRHAGSAGATAAELLLPEVLNGYISHTPYGLKLIIGPSPSTNSTSITSRSLGNYGSKDV